MYQIGERDVVKLKTENFDPNTGGAVSINYLTSGISGDTDDIYLDIARDGDS